MNHHLLQNKQSLFCSRLNESSSTPEKNNVFSGLNGSSSNSHDSFRDVRGTVMIVLKMSENMSWYF